MRRHTLAAVASAIALLAPHAAAQRVTLTGDSSDINFYTGTNTKQLDSPTGPPTGAYSSYATRITLTGSTTTEISTSTITGLPSTDSTTFASNGTATSTSEEPVNTQPCNNYVELCRRKYSNITNVAAHNSPFVRPGNSGSNQELPVNVQLDDGIRLVQAQIQWPSNSSSPHFCHTSCDLLDAGPITQWLTQVREWVDAHPYDVVTILMGNGNYSDPSLYVPYIEETGLLKYAYEAPVLPMTLDDWPTLEEMIVRGKRVVMFLDYMADQVRYPWLLDQFSQMWETPFDPLDQAFPCTPQRPPELSDEGARDRLYLMNHNLNAKFDVFGTELLVPAVALLNQTNAAEGYGSAGLAANNCRADWGRAPNFINVDYYNYGTPPGSVFEAAARINNVTYNGDCCGKVTSSAAALGRLGWWTLTLGSLTLGVCLL